MLIWSTMAMGGVYVWAGIPIIIGAVALAILQRPSIASSPDTRLLDFSLLAFLGCVALQLVPLPLGVVTALSPRSPGIRADVSLDAPTGASAQALSIDPDATLYGLLLAAGTIVFFWSCRGMYHRGGIRRTTRSLAWLGLAISLLAIIQRATSTGLVYWWWEPTDENASPFGPFINRNHFATWVLMAMPLVIGYVVARQGRPRRSRRNKSPLAFLWEFSDLSGLWLTSAAVLMTLALFASMSRSGLTSIALAAGAWLWFVQQRVVGWRGRVWFGAWAGAVLLVALGWTNMDLVLARFDAALVEPTGGRLEIWQDTMTVVRDFWLTGTGLTTYPTSMYVYQVSHREVFFNQAHNHYLQLASEGGLLLTVPMFVAVAAFSRLAYRRLKNETSWRYWIRAGALVGLTAVAIQSFWETGLRMPANALLAAALAAAAVHAPRRAESRPRQI